MRHGLKNTLKIRRINMQEEVVIYRDGYIDSSTEESIKIKDLEQIDGEFTSKAFCGILDTGLYTHINYYFDYNKTAELFDEYVEKYSEDHEFGDETIKLYSPDKNGGVKDVYSIRNCNVILPPDNLFTAFITIEAHGGKQFGWGGKEYYSVQLHNYKTGIVNVEANFITSEMACEFLKRLVSCVVKIDKDDLIDRVNSASDTLIDVNETINKMCEILKKNL